MDLQKVKKERKVLITKRENKFKRAQLLYDLIADVKKDRTKSSIFQARYKELPKVAEEFADLCERINSLTTEIDPDEELDTQVSQSFDSLYYEIIAFHDTFFPDHTPVESKSDSQQNISIDYKVVQPRLPNLDPPTFDGSYKNWTQFYDQFKSLIHDNSRVTTIEKFHYLRSNVSGPAASVVRSLPLIETNYQIVWENLVKKYHNKRVLGSDLLDTLINFSINNNATTGRETASTLNKFLEEFGESVTSLKSLLIPDLSDFIILNLALRSLPTETRKNFEYKHIGNNIPTFEQLKTFIENQSKVLEVSGVTDSKPKPYTKSSPNNDKPNSNSNKYNSYNKKPFSNLASTSDYTGPCPACKISGHSIYKCPTFNQLNPSDRRDLVKSLKFCFNCLKPHLISKCTSKTNCLKCGHRHSTLLHDDNFANTFRNNNNYKSSSSTTTTSNNNSALLVQAANPLPNQSNNSEISNTPIDVNSALSSHDVINQVNNTNDKFHTVVLGTALVHIKSFSGHFVPCRTLIDCGGQASFLSSKCAQKLGLPIKKSKIPITGIGLNVAESAGTTSCSLKPLLTDGPILDTQVIVLPKMTSTMPSCHLPDNVYQSYKHLNLADPKFNEPGPIDFIIGADLYSLVMTGQKTQASPSVPYAWESIFGWIIMGPTGPNIPYSINTFLTSVPLLSDNIIKKFWEVEEPPKIDSLSPEDITCEEIFTSQHSRDPNGRYIVPILMKPNFDESSCSSSYSLALSRLISLERRLTRHPEVKIEYQKFLDEYLSLGHMTQVPYTPYSKENYVIPHHAVFKESSSSTKLRIVFDGSSKPSGHSSLNESLYIGCKLQHDIVEIILRFRLHFIIFISDICKMFRQVLILPKDRRFQHILWRKTPDSEIEEYELNTITYGLTSSPYLSLRTLKQLIIDEGHKYPKAAAVLDKDLYIDDAMTGSKSIHDALLLKDELVKLLELGGFELRKWSSNSEEFIQSIPQDLRETPLTFDPDVGEVVKVLGLQFNPKGDFFSYQVTQPCSVCTKRSILSFVARIYDPLGWLCPVIFRLKCLIQHLWRLGLSWDQSVPSYISEEWNSFCDQIQHFSDFKLKRYVLHPDAISIRLVGFCDGSQSGYCAVVYLYVTSNFNPPSSELLIAKSKVAPLKTLTIPRIELCGAVLLSKLLKYVFDIYSPIITINSVHAFTDSTTVLSWIKTPPHLLKTYVASRVVQILDSVSPSSWNHISTESNPADCGSRGLKPRELLEHSLWFHGPSWLSDTYENWPLTPFESYTKDLPELKPLSSVNSFHQTTPKATYGSIPIENFSSFFKLQRLIAWFVRFINNCKLSPDNRIYKNSPLSTSELNYALNVIVRQVQREVFPNEIKCIKEGKDVSAPLNHLAPYIDPLGCLRVGGRLTNAHLPDTSRNPLILPKNHHLTYIIIDYYHLKYLHVGPRALQAILCSQFWILSARAVIRSRLSKCLTCFRCKPTVNPPFMGTLPKQRVTVPIRPFINVGLDFGGPFIIKESNRRNSKLSKCYLCLFVCMATKAVHLELVSDLSTSAFLASLDRFVSRRGLCANIYSDCGTNFVGAKHYLSDLYKFLKENQHEVQTELSKVPINWMLHPPASPHFNGLSEAGIRSAKYHLKRTMGNQTLTFEELSTLFCRIEAIMNSRPLCSQSTDPNDLSVITPGHLLIGTSLVAVPEVNLLDEKLNTLSRWQLLTYSAQHFWKRWSKEYLHTLQQRAKWFTSQRNLKVGDLVLVLEERLPPLQWKMARVESVHPGRDGVVRVASIKTAQGSFLRPAVKLCPLPSQ